MPTLRETMPLQKKIVIKKTIDFTIWLFVCTFTSCFLLFIDERSRNIWLSSRWFHLLIIAAPIIFVGLVLYAAFLQYLDWKKYFYDIDDIRIIIKNGSIWRYETIIPLEKVNKVYINQGMFDSFLGLYNIHICLSVSFWHIGLSTYHIDGLDKEGSQKLRQLILEKINKEEK